MKWSLNMQNGEISSAASYAVILCGLSQGKFENVEMREAKNGGGSQFAKEQDGRRDVKDASSGTTPIAHQGDVWRR